jgi:hypothetical protein
MGTVVLMKNQLSWPSWRDILEVGCEENHLESIDSERFWLFRCRGRLGRDGVRLEQPKDLLRTRIFLL